MDACLGDICRSFPFLLPTRIEFGPGVSDRLADEVREFGTRAIIVTDAGIVKAGLVDAFERRLENAGIATVICPGVEPNPHPETVEAVAEIGTRHRADVVIALGGGSVLDAGKAAAAVMRWGGPVSKYEGLDRVPGPNVPVIAMPTTAGTGSEVTLWAMITDRARQYKMPIGSFHLMPRLALVDPRLTYDLSPSLTASTAMDALSHAIEAYTSRASNPLSDSLSLQAIRLLSRFLERAVVDGHDHEARCGVMLASLMAGVAVGNSDTTAAHSMAEAMGGALHVPHGVACAICLPYVMAHNLSAAEAKIGSVGRAMGVASEGLSEAELAQAAVDALFDLCTRLGIPTMATAGVTAGDVPKLVQLAMMNLGTPDNPVEMDERAFQMLFFQALEGRPGQS